MDTAPRKPKRRKPVVLAVVLVLLPVLYVLELGPIVAMYDAGRLPQGALRAFQIVYTPLRLLTNNSELCERVIDAYVDLWR